MLVSFKRWRVPVAVLASVGLIWVGLNVLVMTSSSPLGGEVHEDSESPGEVLVSPQVLEHRTISEDARSAEGDTEKMGTGIDGGEVPSKLNNTIQFRAINLPQSLCAKISIRQAGSEVEKVYLPKGHRSTDLSLPYGDYVAVMEVGKNQSFGPWLYSASAHFAWCEDGDPVITLEYSPAIGSLHGKVTFAGLGIPRRCIVYLSTDSGAFIGYKEVSFGEDPIVESKEWSFSDLPDGIYAVHVDKGDPISVEISGGQQQLYPSIPISGDQLINLWVFEMGGDVAIESATCLFHHNDGTRVEFETPVEPGQPYIVVIDSAAGGGYVGIHVSGYSRWSSGEYSELGVANDIVAELSPVASSSVALKMMVDDKPRGIPPQMISKLRFVTSVGGLIRPTRMFSDLSSGECLELVAELNYVGVLRVEVPEYGGYGACEGTVELIKDEKVDLRLDVK